MSSVFLRRLCALGVAGLLIGAGGFRFSADLLDLPGNAAARALAAHGNYLTDAPALVLRSRSGSLRVHDTAARRADVGRALMAGHDPRPEAAVEAFAEALRKAPGSGQVWAEYAGALLAAGRASEAAAALELSTRLSLHDPVARRVRASLSR